MRLRATDLQSGPSIKLAAYWARYCEIHLPLLRESSQRAYRASLTHAVELLGPSPLHQVGPEEVQRLIGKMHEARLARATIRQAVVRLLSLLKRARREGFAVQTVSFRALSMPSERNARRESRAVSAEELEQVLAASAPREQAMWVLGALAGCRAGEIMALMWTDVDLERGVVRVRASATGGRIHAAKTAKSVRSIPMLPRLQQILSTYRGACNGQPEQFLFATKGGKRPIDQADVRKRIWHPLLSRLGIERMGLHALRHSLAARLAQLGMGEAEAAAWLGHGNLRQTRAYTHLQEAQLLKSLSAALQRTGESGK
jgi:integrase